MLAPVQERCRTALPQSGSRGETGAVGGKAVRVTAAAARDMEQGGEVTRILRRLKEGDSSAGKALIECVHDELKALARSHMHGQRRQHTLQPSALVDEAYMRLFRGVNPDFEDRAHFMRAASRAMRCVLVDHAREKARLKRAANGERLPIESLAELFEERAQDMEELDAALERLARFDPRSAEVVELLFFGGCSKGEIAELLGISKRTVEREWTTARAWLKRELE